MGFNPEDVLTRDRHRCRFMFPSCLRRASRVMLDCPEWLGGPVSYANARAVCDRCGEAQQQQRERAAVLFAGR
jgi:hypothetical protein